MAAHRIPAISPIARVPATWPAAREAASTAAPAQPVPVARPAAPGGLSDSTLGALASMAPALAPHLLAAATDRDGQRRGMPTPFGEARADTDTLPAPLAATLVPPEARLLRANSAPAAPLAAAWRAQVLSGDRGLARAAEPARGPRPAAAPPAWATAEFPALALLPLAASQAMAAQHAALGTSPPGLPAGATPLALPGLTPDKLGYLLHAWNGLPVALRLVEAEPEDAQPLPQQAGLPALRLALALPTLGRLVLQMQLAHGGVWLAVAVEEASALPYVQAALPAITSALGQAGLRLLRWRLERGAGHGAAFNNPPLQLPPTAVLLAPALFRAAAEIVLVLQQVELLAAAEKTEPAQPPVVTPVGAQALVKPEPPVA